MIGAGLDPLDLLEIVLADITDIQRAGILVEREPVGVPEAEGEDLLDDAGHPHEGVVGGDPVLSIGRVRAVDVDAEDLAERVGELLAIAV